MTVGLATRGVVCGAGDDTVIVYQGAVDIISDALDVNIEGDLVCGAGDGTVIVYQGAADISDALDVNIEDHLVAERCCSTGDSRMAGSSRFTMKRHDLRPSLRMSIKSGGEAMDLTGVIAAMFYMRDPSGTVVVSAAATVEVPATLGVVRYDWQAGDTDESGTYQAEFELDYGGGDKLTVPNTGYLTVVIIDDIDGA